MKEPYGPRPAFVEIARPSARATLRLAPDELRYELPFSPEYPNLVYIDRLTDAAWFTPLQIHDYFELCFVAAGDGWFILDGAKHPVGAGVARPGRRMLEGRRLVRRTGLAKVWEEWRMEEREPKGNSIEAFGTEGFEPEGLDSERVGAEGPDSGVGGFAAGSFGANGIKAVLFDLDNTVLDRTRMFGGFMDAFFARYFGHAEDPRALRARVAEPDMDGYKPREALFAELLDELPWARKQDPDELAAFYRGAYLPCAVLMDGAREVPARARAKYRTGLITNGKASTQYGKLDRLGIRDAFDLILVSEEAGAKKPDPRLFAMAAGGLGLRAGECLFVGDHPANDVEGAARFGMATVWMRLGRSWPDGMAAEPGRTIDRLGELLALP